MTTVLVCGPRDFTDRGAVFAILDALRPGPSRIVAGDARGVDALALAWAADRGIERKTYRADWAKWGRRAGPIRNEAMLRAEDPDLVIAIKYVGRETPGTADMLRRARDGQCPVHIWRVSPFGFWREGGV
ncbi:MAG TPA: SLOG family protein [Thermomicrobiales bacterium]|nr:SLOG family protein [Thermomicrobiales bacterium]